jgi:hypothetical protein
MAAVVPLGLLALYIVIETEVHTGMHIQNCSELYESYKPRVLGYRHTKMG